MKVFLLLLIISTVSSQKYSVKLWQRWKRIYGKFHPQGEDFVRRAVWEKTQKQIEEHNKRFKEGTVSYRIEANRFSDMGYSELRSKFTRTYSFAGATKSLDEFSSHRLPRKVDWRRKNGSCVSSVQYQGGPGSCFAFTAIGALEGQLCKKTGKMTPLSVQQVLDCETGTCGGYFDGIYDYIIRQRGIMSNEDYPYSTCRDCMQCLVADPRKTFIPMINRFLCDSRCKFNIKKRKAVIKKFVQVYPTELELKKAVATIGPIAAGIDARPVMALYSRHNDVYYNPKCSSTQLNHAVLIVGYGTTKNGQDYWLVKNSWGDNWGVRGYMRMSRNKGNNCGIATAAMYPAI